MSEIKTNVYEKVQEILNMPSIKIIPNIEEKVVREIYLSYLQKAYNITKNDNYTEITPYVKDATIKTIIRLGDEGMNSRSEGGISSTYIDIEEKMRNDLIKDGNRRYY